MRIHWKKTSVGGYMTQHTGFISGERSAMITPDGDSCEWHAAFRDGNASTYRTFATVKAAKAWVKRLWG